jgi:general secretion pathway protein G
MIKNFQFKKRKQNGFTLIELLVAVSIIGMLSALLLVNLQGTRSRARDTQRKNDLYQLKNALRMYYNDHQHYPGTGTGNTIAGCGSGADSDCDWGDSFGPDTGVYMKVLPNDPLNAQDSSYTYVYSSSGGDDFTLYACLENASDPDATDESSCTKSGKKYEVSND